MCGAACQKPVIDVCCDPKLPIADPLPGLGSRLMRFRLCAALVALLVGASACFIFNRGASDPRPAFDVPEGEIALNVTNHNYLDVVVYVLHDGQQTRVGTVTGSSSAVFFLPVRLLSMGHELQLLGDPIGSPDYARTPTLVIQPAQYIEWTLRSEERRSSVGVF